MGHWVPAAHLNEQHNGSKSQLFSLRGLNSISIDVLGSNQKFTCKNLIQFTVTSPWRPGVFKNHSLDTRGVQVQVPGRQGIPESPRI